MTQQKSWARTLRTAQSTPATVLGTDVGGHLNRGIRDPLRLMWEKRVLSKPQSARIRVSPQHYHVTCESGPLREEIERLVAWRDCDIVIQELYATSKRLLEMEADWARLLHDPTLPLGGPGSPLFLADRGIIALRLSGGLWCQSYKRGWPTTPPLIVNDAGASVGLMIAAALSGDCFKGLPFTREGVDVAVPEVARPHISVEWHDEDDIVPDCRADPTCILHPENIHRWL
jgi:hypothetical protein